MAKDMDLGEIVLSSIEVAVVIDGGWWIAINGG